MRVNEPRVGDEAPDFTLMGTNGETLSLEDFKNKRNIVLMFYRADWCPYCAEQLSVVQKFVKDFEEQDAELVPVSTDGIEKEESFAEEICVNYPLYSDPDHKAIERYGVFDAEHNIARPAVFIIDKEGRIRYKHVSKDHTDRPMNTTIINALKIVNGWMPEHSLPMYKHILGME
ncbi:MAG: peroxiredoxin family protein [Candidatus Hydrothermarchaeaceae archaeon]